MTIEVKQPNYKKFANLYVKRHSPFPKEYKVGPWSTSGPVEFQKSLVGKSKNEMIWMIDIRDQVLGTMQELLKSKKQSRVKK